MCLSFINEYRNCRRKLLFVHGHLVHRGIGIVSSINMVEKNFSRLYESSDNFTFRVFQIGEIRIRDQDLLTP